MKNLNTDPAGTACGAPPPVPRRGGRRGFTLIELLVVLAVIALLALAAMPRARRAVTRAKVTQGVSRLRAVSHALQIYRADHDSYPPPVPMLPVDPIGVLARSALTVLTTPTAYLSPESFIDPFGAPTIQGTAGSDRRRRPISISNPEQSVLYGYYPHFADLFRKPDMNEEGFAVISLGPDHKDSFIIYYPFPESLPGSAAAYGILNIHDTVYDPTNGAGSAGDLAAFGGQLRASGVTGGQGQ